MKNLPGFLVSILLVMAGFAIWAVLVFDLDKNEKNTTVTQNECREVCISSYSSDVGLYLSDPDFEYTGTLKGLGYYSKFYCFKEIK